MILSPSGPDAGRLVLDRLVSMHAARDPDRVAVIDAPDRSAWTDGVPRQLTWAQFEAEVSGLAARFLGLGLKSDGVILLQGPNSIDTIIVMVAAMRAQLIPALLPPGWRNREAALTASALNAVGIAAATRFGPDRPAERLREVAAEQFGLRFVFSFGGAVPDGAFGLEELMATPVESAKLPPQRTGNPADHVALITFDAQQGGIFPVARSHENWIAAGLALVGTGELVRDSVLLSSHAPTGLAGLSTGILPWLISGSTLVLHQAFDAAVLGVQIESHRVTHLVLPAVAMAAAVREGLLDTASLVHLISTQRPGPHYPLPPLTTDMAAKTAHIFGEIAVVVSPPEDRLPVGTVEDSPTTLEASVVDNKLHFRGAMVPTANLPAKGLASYPVNARGAVSTGYFAAIANGAINVTAHREDVITIGGQAVPSLDVETLYADVDGALGVNASAEPDALLGQRLQLSAMPASGSPVSAVALAMHAEAKGASPLMASADSQIGERRRALRFAQVA